MLPENPDFIVKRSGQTVKFNAAKIRDAIRKAGNAVSDEEITEEKVLSLTNQVLAKIPPHTIPTVEQVQDIVEEVLIANDLPKTSKAYILYRAERSKLRQTEKDLMDIFKSLTFVDAKDSNIKRENANIDTDTAMGTMLKYGSESAKYFVDNSILDKDIADAHNGGDIHIHDKDFYMLTETCCQIDLLKLFKDGFSTGHGHLREPMSIQSYSALACIAIQANQNEMHGGQSVPNFDYSMAPGVAKTFIKEYFKALGLYLKYRYDVSESASEEAVACLERDMPRDIVRISNKDGMEQRLLAMRAEGKLPGVVAALSEDEIRKLNDSAFDTALTETDRATYQAMEGLIHNLNTMHSRAGAQVPFSSINYGTDTSPEGRMVMRNLLLATDAGLGNGETPIFPVQIFKVKEGVNFNKEDPNYDLFRLSCKVSAKRLFPNFSFLDAPFNLQYYKPGDYNTEVAYMGCRTRVMGNVHDRSREITCGRGNLSFTTINLPRIGIEAKGDWNLFYSMLDSRIDLVFKQLLHRFKIQCSKKVRNYPFLMGQGVWIDSDGLDIDDSVAEVLKHGTLSVGFIGLAETLKAMTGQHHGESEESYQLGLDIIRYMRGRMDKKSAETGLNFTLLATPAEGLSGRFVKIDAKKYGSIEGVTDREYYTNSFHIPVYHNISAFKKLRLEAPFHALCNAGHISYVELDGDMCNNIDAFETVIKYMKEVGIGYGSINHPVDRDPICGYTGVIGNCCPRCGRHSGEGVSVEKLRELRKKYPNMPHFVGID
ncbi:MAG: anaerobic ribonucleoside triphosphate reductase [Clostridia bacterium]|nr:anaerobic ribonucleoside triphosphate reductase [Clostridia bacterium]